MASDKIVEYIVSEVEPKKKEKLEKDSSLLWANVDENSVNKDYKIVCEYNPSTNVSMLYKISEKNNKKTFIKEYPDKVLKIKKDLTQTYLVTKNKDGKVGVIDHAGNVIIEHKYDSISFAKLPGANKTVLRVQNKNKEGLITLKGKQILACEYDSIDLTQSLYSAGKFRFFVQKRDDREYNDFENWGVVDERGRVLLDFNYQHNGENGVHYYKRHKEHGKPTMKYLSITDCKTRHTAYFNIKDKDFIASTETLKKMDVFEEKVETKAKKLASSHNYKYHPASTNKMDEDTRHAIAFTTAIITTSPIAGLIVNEMLK